MGTMGFTCCNIMVMLCKKGGPVSDITHKSGSEGRLLRMSNKL